MKKIIILTLFVIGISEFSSAQFVANMKIKEPIEGLCNKDLVYAILPGVKGQVEATATLNDKEIVKKLNDEIQFLKENPNFNGKGMIGLVINCAGEVVKCKMDVKTKSLELDNQIVDVFNSLGNWKYGMIDKKKVDSTKMFSIVIKNGRLIFD